MTTTDAINGKIARLLVSEYDKTNSPMYPHLDSTDTVTNLGYDSKRGMMKWSNNSDGRVCYAATNSAAIRAFEKRMVLAQVGNLAVVDPDWAAFCAKVDATDCTSQWADRGSDHD